MYKETPEFIAEEYEGPSGKVLLTYRESSVNDDYHNKTRPRIYNLYIEVNGKRIVMDSDNADGLPQLRIKLNALVILARSNTSTVQVPYPKLSDPELKVGEMMYYATTLHTQKDADDYMRALVNRGIRLLRQRQQAVRKIMKDNMKHYFGQLESTECERLYELYHLR